MAFLCPARVRRAVRKRKARRDDAPLPGRITGSASIDTLVRVGLEKEALCYEGRPTARVLHDFKPCVEDELLVREGEVVTLLYRENDWVYVLGRDGREGFIPYVYCGGIGADLHVHDRRPSSAGSEATTHTDTLSRRHSASMPSINDPELYKHAQDSAVPPKHAETSPYRHPQSQQAPPVTHTPYGSRVSKRPQEHVQEPYSYHDHSEIPDSLSNSNASDTPLLGPLDVSSFDKRRHGRYIVLFRFQSLEENDVSVERGEFVTVLNKDDPDWFWIGRSDGQEGFVPSRFLCAADASKSASSLSQKTSSTELSQTSSSVATSPAAAAARTRLVVLYDYCARAPDDLTVCRGDWVYADLGTHAQRDREWLWAFLPGPDKWGFMPRTYAHVPAPNNDTAALRTSMEQLVIR